MSKISGIYLIRADKLGSEPTVYIGQSKDIYQRKRRHFNHLRKNIHCNRHLQAFYNKYGQKSICFNILMECHMGNLDFWEKFFIRSVKVFCKCFNHLDGGIKPPDPVKKPCIMQNIKTGEIVKFDSLLEFADRFKFSASQVSAVVAGKNKHIHDWFCVSHKWEPKMYTVINLKGQTFDFFCIRKFAIEHNLPPVQFSGMIKGVSQSCYGWKRLDSTPQKICDYQFQSPTGEIFKGKNISQFAKEYKLQKSHLHALTTGKRLFHKGWTLATKGEV